MFSFFWNLALALLLIAALPRYLYRFRKSPDLMRALKEKMGFGFPSDMQAKPVIWIHAVSVGEVKAVSSLASRLKSELPNATLIISTTTLTGNQEAKKSIREASHVVFLPFDISFIVRRVLKNIRPSLVILSETDFWFQFLTVAKDFGAKIVLVNGKISEKSTDRLARFKFVRDKLYGLVDLFLLQSIEYQERFLALGVPKEKIAVTGNLKLDMSYKNLSTEEKEALRQRLGIGKRDATVVFASTHPGEEELALAVAKAIKPALSNARIVIVPRHPERFDKVAALIKESGLSFFRLTDSKQNFSNSGIVLVDAMGLLGAIYQVADLAVVCGSFAPVGGHNILEPLPFKVPVLFGPHMFKQPEFTALIQKYRAGKMVSHEELSGVVEDLLSDRAKREEMGLRGLKLIDDNQGASLRSLERILEIMKK